MLSIKFDPFRNWTPSDRAYGAFRVLDSEGNIFDEAGLNEAEATDLAIWLNGSIQHWNPDYKQWFNW